MNTVAEPSSGAQVGRARGARYVTLMGGLGNQVFQYLFARRLAALGVRIDGFVPRFADDTYGRSILVERVAREPLRLLPEGLPDGVGVIGGEDLDAIVETLSRHPDAPVLLTGYWQRIEYVDALDACALVETPGHVNALCAVHLRRVDYGHHGHLPLHYYREALASLGHPEFVVYGDEPNFARHHFGGLPNFRGVVVPRLDDPVRDFRRLAAHASVVASNSSFAWLAAYLSSRKHGARVVLPSAWSLLPGTRPIGAARGWTVIDTKLVTP